LGLGKLNSSVIKEDNAAIRGMITAVSHLVTVEEVN
ncbi:TPA: 50S ribosomal protein L30, partial [Streptococcus pneumoniae]